MIKKIIKFSATWCGPCKTLSPIVEEVANEYEIEVETYDADDDAEKFSEYGIRNVPTLFYCSDEQIVDKTTGSLTKEQLIEIIENSKN